MGNPIDQAAAPVGMSKGGGGGSSRGHHRQSLSISSLPLEKLAKINCDKRTSVSAVSSPRSSSTVTVEKPQQSIASFLGQVDSRSRKPSRSINAAATELASESDRKPSSFNPFRGHRRVGSGSNVVAKAVWDYSPRLRVASSCSSSASAASSPKKLVDKYAVSKIAASLFHSPAKLERSMSLTRAASHRASSVVVQAKLNHTVAAVGEIISSASSDAAVIPRNSSSCNSDHGGQRAGAGSHSSPANIEDAANPSSAQSAMLNSPEFESAAEILEGGESANMEAPESPTTISAASLFEETTGGPTTTNSNLSEEYAISKVTTEEELTEAAVRCSISSSSDGGGNNSPDMVDSPGVSTEQEVLRNKKRDFMMLRVSSAPRAMSMSMSPGSSSSSSSSSSSHEAKMSVMKSTLRKRRRSASASGIGAMLLKVVRVPESGTIVARKFVGASSSSDGAAVDCSFSVEKSTSSPVLPAGRLVGDCETDLPDDAVKSTYSKFVDIEIYPAHGCVELVQHSKDGVDDDPSLKKTRLGASSARFSHPPPVKINSCAVHEGKTKARKMKTIRRGKMTSIDMDTLKEYLKTTDSDPCAALPQVDTPRSEPSLVSSSPPSSSPPSPPQQPQLVLESNLSMREKSRTCVSRLQAPSSGAYSYVDIYRPCSVSILANPSFSSSHQDKIWEEQAEIYSSGGRGTPGREDESAATPSSTQQPPTPAAASTTLLYSLHHSPSPSGFGSSNGNSQQPHEHHSAMRTSKGLGSGLSTRAGSPSSESGHFMHHIMSRIRGTSPKSVNAAASAASGGNNTCPKSSQSMEISKRRNPWSSCICFSVKS